MPSSCGNVAAKFRARVWKVSGRSSCVRVDRAAVVVDRVVPAPEDPAVRGEPVVVELVAGVRDPDARVPPQCHELLLGQRLGRQHVVVDRHHAPGIAAQRSGEDVGREHHVLRPHHSPAGGCRDPVACLLQRLEAGALGDAHTQPLDRVGQPPRQPGRVDHRRLVRVEPAGQVRRRGHQLLDSRRVEEAGKLWLQPLDLVLARRHGELPAPRPSAVDAMAPQRLLDLVEVAHPELVHHVVLVGPPLPAVGLAVRQARLAEAAVAPGRVLRDPVRLDEQDPSARLPLDRTQRRPESREPATHDEQVGVPVPVERRPRRRPRGVVQPQRPQHGFGQGVHADHLRPRAARTARASQCGGGRSRNDAHVDLAGQLRRSSASGRCWCAAPAPVPRSRGRP